MNRRWSVLILIVICLSLLAVGYNFAASRKASAKLSLTITSSTDIVYLTFAPNSKLIAVTDMENPAKIRDVGTGKVVSQLKNSRDTLEIIFSASGKMVAGVTDAGTIKLWDVASGRHVATLKGHQTRVPERGYVYDASTGRTSYPTTMRKVPASISGIDISPDEKLLATGSDDKTIEIWSLTSHKRLRVFKDHRSPVSGVTFSPSGKSIASVGENGVLELWNPYTGRSKGTIKIGAEVRVRWSSNGMELFTSSNRNGNISVWDTKTLKLKKTVNDGLKDIYPINPTQMARYSADRSRLAMVEDAADLSHQSRGGATIYDVKSGLALYGFITAKPNTSDLSPDGKLLAIGGVEYNQKYKNGFRKVIEIWRVP